MTTSFSVDFAGHPAQLRHEAPQITELISNTRARVEAEAHAFHDQRAIAAQARYKRWMRVANACISITSVLGASSMAATLVAGEIGAYGLTLARTLSFATALSAACGAISLYKLREGKLIESWMTARAQAEFHRLGYFTVLAGLAAARPEPQRLLGFLDYCQRYHLDVEREFYGTRAQSHERSADLTVTIGAVGAGMATLFGILGAASNGAWSAVGVLSVAGAACGAFAATRELMNDDRRNAERYGRTWAGLQRLMARMDDVREAAAQSNGKAVEEFIAAFNDQVSMEHRQWLEGSESVAKGLDRLAEALSSVPAQGRAESGQGR